MFTTMLSAIFAPILKPMFIPFLLFTPMYTPSSQEEVSLDKPHQDKAA